MRILLPATPLVDQVVGKQKYAKGQAWRLMSYVIQCPVSDGVLLYHALTCALVLLTKREAANITVQRKLIAHWFLVPEQHDDRKLCLQIRQLAAVFKPKPKATTGYTILPTTGCNARCFYCYEKGTKAVGMTAETASSVARYIMAHRGDEKVKLSWFGGEPLVNARVIDQICTELRENGVPYHSSMISNGYLFDADMVQRAKELWLLGNVQITLDGTEQTYNSVKSYVYKGVNAFERVLKNIGLLTAAGISVAIRLNVDKHNIGEMPQLVTLLHQRFGQNKHLSVYSHALFGERTADDSAALFAQRMQLEQLIKDCGYWHRKGLLRDIKLNNCMSDNDQSVVIAPTGHLGKCEHYVDRHFFGHIDSEERDETVISKFRERQGEVEACAACAAYPQCIRLVMCEDDCGCTPEKRQEHLNEIVEAMIDEYRNYLNKKVHETEI